MLSIKQIVSVFVLILLISAINGIAQSESGVLELGKPIERELRGGETHSYRITLAAGQFLHIIAKQKGIDVVLILIAADGKQLIEVDSPNGSQGPESLYFFAESTEDYRLEVGSSVKEAKAGLYEINVKELRTGTADDKYFGKGKRLLSEGGFIANVRTSESRVDAAEKFEEAARLFRQIENIERKAAGLSDIGAYYVRYLQFDKSIEIRKESAELFEKAGLGGRAALEYRDLGDSYKRLYLYENALNCFKKMLSIGEMTNDKFDQSRAFAKMGELHYQLGDYESSLPETIRALRLAEEVGNTRAVIGSLNLLGLVYTSMGNYVRALEIHQRQLTLRKGLRGQVRSADIMLNIGIVYGYQRNYEQALDYFQKALAGFKAEGEGEGVSFALDNIGEIYSLLGKYAEAIDYFNQSRELGERLGLPPTVNLLITGTAYKYQRKYADAQKYLGQAIEWSERTGITYEKALALNGLADVYYQQGDLMKSLEYATDAGNIAEKSGFTSVKILSLTTRAKINIRLGKIQDARRELGEAITEIEDLRKQVTAGEKERTSFYEDKAEPFRLLIDLLVLGGETRNAFSYAERVKSRTLLEVLGNASLDLSKTLSAQERTQERALKQELVSLNMQVTKARHQKDPEISDIVELEKQLNKKRLDIEDFQTRLYASHPELKIQRGEIKPITLEETALLLPDHKTALAEFVVAEEKTFLFVITKDAAKQATLKAFTVDVKDKDLAKRVEFYRTKLASGDLDFHKASRELYDLLLKPATAQLAGKTNLIIVPDGPLWDLPFQALQNGKGRYLVEQASISYAPGLTALKEMSKKAKTRPRNADLELLAFGNPIVGKETAERVQRVFMSEKLEPLPESERLVNELGKMYGANRSKVYIGDQAREETAKTESPKYRIVQFATHGILNNVSPMYSHLVLAQNDKNPNEDGLLEAWEMKDLDLKADMVILSACETARGRISNGEGVIGMSWAMFIAGTPTTVASQWKVESKSTTELMLEFHRQLLKGNVSKAEALRRASLKVMKMPKYRHPSYWGAFVIVGNPH